MLIIFEVCVHVFIEICLPPFLIILPVIIKAHLFRETQSTCLNNDDLLVPFPQLWALDNKPGNSEYLTHMAIMVGSRKSSALWSRTGDICPGD